MKTGFGRWSLRAFLRFVRAFSAHRVIEGIHVYAFLGDESERETVFAKFEAALALVREHDPKAHRRLQRGFDYLLVINGTGGLASAWVEQRVCRIEHDYVLKNSTTPTRLGSTLVHEGTHAHLHVNGVTYREGVRKRIEDVCVSSEIAFLRRLPEWDAALARHTIRARGYPASRFGDEAFVEEQKNALRELGAPERLIRWFGKKRLAKLKDRHGT